MRIAALFVFLAMVAGGAYFWLNRSGGLAPDGIGELCGRLPKETAALLVLDLRQEVDLRRELGSLRSRLQDVPEATKAIANVEAALGSKLEEIADWAEPAAFVAVLSAPGAPNLWASLATPNPGSAQKIEQPELIWGTPVKDESRARAFVNQLLEKNGAPKPPEETVNGSSFFVLDRARFGFHRGYLLGASSKSALEALLGSLEGKTENLTRQPVFQEVRHKLPAKQGFLVYLPLAGLGSGLQGLLGEQALDSQGVAGLDSLTFVAGSAATRNGRFEATTCLGVRPDNPSALARALVTPPTAQLVSARMVPAEWNHYSAVNLRYVLNLGLEVARLNPGARAQIQAGLSYLEAASGVSLEKDLWEAFSGEVAWTGDLLTKLPRWLQGTFDRSRSASHLTTCMTNLKNLATACEMYSTDFAGRYPESLQQLTPVYLRSLPTCPSAGKDSYSASYRVSASPDSFRLACLGHNHGVDGDFPQYTAEQGLLVGGATESMGSREEPMPSTLVLVGVKNREKAEQLVDRLNALVPFTPAKTVGDSQLFEFKGASMPVYRALVTRPEPMLLIASGPDAAALIETCLQARAPVAETAEFKEARRDAGDRWVSQSYLDLSGLSGALREVLAESSQDAQKKLLAELLAGFAEARGVSYTVAERDGLRLVSRGDAAVASGTTAVVAAILVPNFIKARAQGQLTACKSNEKNIATALEMYASDNAGRYPANLEQLTPDYLRRLPTCPAAQSDTYSQTYEFSSAPDSYSFYCSGHHHSAAGARENRPAYNAMEGLIGE